MTNHPKNTILKKFILLIHDIQYPVRETKPKHYKTGTWLFKLNPIILI